MKEVAIKTPDGTEVKVGAIIYTLEIEDSYAFRNRRKGKWSGDSRVTIVPNKVVDVLSDRRSRSFTIQSDRGCEHTYSVKDNCLMGLHGKKSSALKAKKEIDKEDARHIQGSINSRKETIAKFNQEIKKAQLAIKKLS